MPRTFVAIVGVVLFSFSSPAIAQHVAPSGAAEWIRGATCYEVFVRSFHDSDGDGVGDLNGLIAKLDYINDGNQQSRRDLGARCIWLMPIAASPSYHGYDVTDYYRVNPEYGTNADFKRLMTEAHRRGIRVLIDMVLNHSSSEHPYFKRAALDPASPYRDWYTWLPKDPGIKNSWGANNWHRSPYGEDYYFGFFWSGMPDLNVQNPEVVAEMKKIATFWLEEMGVDGFRLDAIKHLVEADSGRIVEHQPGTHVFLREYGAHVRRVRRDAFTIGEVWDSIGAMLPYYPDQLDSHFAFEMADAILTAVNSGSAKGLLPPALRLQRELPADRFSPFLRNHDQTRTMTFLKGNVARAKLASTLLLTLPGVPFIYYGEELGMTGDKPDPRLRTPMHWTRDRAAGFTRGEPWEPLQPDSLTANVEAQDGDAQSLLTLHRTLIHLRTDHPALGSGRLIAVSATDTAIAAFVRRAGNRAILVLANLGTTPVRTVTLTSTDEILPPGDYVLTDLLADRASGSVRLGAGGRLRGAAPVATLAPLSAHVFELTPRRP